MFKKTEIALTARQFLAILTATLIALGPDAVAARAATATASAPSGTTTPTATPIKHLVIIFDENNSFDHYFGTYPAATNPVGESVFTAKSGTPTVNGYTPALLTQNPNLNPANGAGATNPFRLEPSQAVTSDQNHDYMPEQQAFDMGAMDLFPAFVGSAGPPPNGPQS